MTVAAGLVAQRAGQVGFSAARRTGDQAVAMLLHPLGGAQLFDLCPLQSARMPIIDILQAGGELQLGVVEPRRQGAVFFPQPLSFDQHRQPGLKVQRADVALAALFFQGLCHALQAHGNEFFQVLGVEHISVRLGG